MSGNKLQNIPHK